jgi:hypothetical protein
LSSPRKRRESGDPVGHDARLPVEKPCVQRRPGSWAESRGVLDPRVREDERMTSGCVSRLEADASGADIKRKDARLQRKSDAPAGIAYVAQRSTLCRSLRIIHLK